MRGDNIRYGIDVIPSDDLGKRISRRIQSARATTLAAQLCTDAGSELLSKSHSRALVAVACASSPVTALGIDIEWMAPDRPYAAILSHFLPSVPAPIACEAFYRTWTFLEAHFKAYQHWPPAEELQQVIAAPARDGPWQTINGNHLIQHRVAGKFQLTVLWRSDAPCGIKYVR
jgi:hypothetical protein